MSRSQWEISNKYSSKVITVSTVFLERAPNNSLNRGYNIIVVTHIHKFTAALRCDQVRLTNVEIFKKLLVHHLMGIFKLNIFHTLYSQDHIKLSLNRSYCKRYIVRFKSLSVKFDVVLVQGVVIALYFNNWRNGLIISFHYLNLKTVYSCLQSLLIDALLLRTNSPVLLYRATSQISVHLWGCVL